VLYPLLAAVTALVHGGFVVFVVFGGLLIPRLPWVAWLHLPCAFYGVLIMVFNWRCPLTDLEIRLRQRAGERVEWSEFLYRYLWSWLGLQGREWFIVPLLVITLLLCNWGPYLRLFQGVAGVPT